MEQFLKRIENLLTVKSIVTLALTAVFACQAVRGEVSQDFMMIYTTVIAFYFGTQAQKLQSGAVDSHCVDDQIFNALLVTQDNVDEMLARYAELGYDGK